MNSRRTTALALTAADDLINSQESFSVKQKVSCKYHLTNSLDCLQCVPPRTHASTSLSLRSSPDVL
jgi:hypothetical protein